MERAPVGTLPMTLCLSAYLPPCVSASLLHGFSASLLLCFSASLLLCFSGTRPPCPPGTGTRPRDSLCGADEAAAAAGETHPGAAAVHETRPRDAPPPLPLPPPMCHRPPLPGCERA